MNSFYPEKAIIWTYLTLIGGAIIVFVIIISLIFGGIGSCQSKKAAEKDANNAKAIEQDKGKAEVIGEQRNAQIENNNQTANASNAATANFNRVLNTDSSQRDGNFSAVKSKWCQDHAGDSKCQR